jgi:hypothetical protein
VCLYYNMNQLINCNNLYGGNFLYVFNLPNYEYKIGTEEYSAAFTKMVDKLHFA